MWQTWNRQKEKNLRLPKKVWKRFTKIWFENVKKQMQRWQFSAIFVRLEFAKTQLDKKRWSLTSTSKWPEPTFSVSAFKRRHDGDLKCLSAQAIRIRPTTEQQHPKITEKCRDSNLGLLSEKHECYLCAMEPPSLCWLRIVPNLSTYTAPSRTQTHLVAHYVVLKQSI